MWYTVVTEAQLLVGQHLTIKLLFLLMSKLEGLCRKSILWKMEKYLKDICNEKLESFSCHFLYCPSHRQVYKLSSTDPGHWLFSLEKSLLVSSVFHLSTCFYLSWFKILIASYVFLKVRWQELSFCWDKQHSQNSNKWHLHLLIPPTVSLTREYLRGLHISE